MENTERNYEQEARQQGWKPKEEFSGDESRWVDAETFVKRGEEFVGLLKPRFDKVERELQEMKKVNRDLNEHYQRFQKQKQKEIETLEKQLEARLQKAVTDGDGQSYTMINRELKDLQEQKKEITQPQATQPQKQLSEAQKQWLDNNKWYSKDKTLRVLADVYADELRASGAELTMSESEFLESITEHVKQEMPNKFTNSRKGANPDVELGGKGKESSNSKSKTFKDLPAEAKAACERMVRNGMIPDTDKGRNSYAETYFSEE